MIRRACAGDRPALEALYDISFPGEKSFRKWVFANVWLPEYTLVFERDRHIVSMLMDLPVTLALGDEHFGAHYIYAACTLPEMRGQKLMSALLGRAFADGRAQKQHFSTLITGNDSLFAFYAQFGYDTLSAVGRSTASAAPLPDGFTMRAAQKKDIAAMLDMYKAETRGTLAVFRDSKHYELLIDLYGENLSVLTDRAGDVKAYAFAEAGFDPPMVSELFGPQKALLAAALCNQTGADTVFQGIADENGRRNGCIKPLTDRAQAVLAQLAIAPYINLMFN